MTIDQLIAEVAAQPTQVAAFNTFLACLQIELNDATVGDTPPPSVSSKYNGIFTQANGRANEILTAIETGKSALEPLKAHPPSSPSGPHTPNTSTVFVDKPSTVVPSAAPAATPSSIPSPFGTASTSAPAAA